MSTWRQSFTLLFQCWNHLICFQDSWYTFYRSDDAKYIFRWRRPLVKLPIRSEVETKVYTAHASLYTNYMGQHIIITYICWSDARIILIMKQKFSDTKNNTLKRSKFFVSLPFCFCFFLFFECRQQANGSHCEFIYPVYRQLWSSRHGR